MVEVIKNIAAIVGCVLSCFTLIGILVKPIRTALVRYIKLQSGKSEVDKQLFEIHEMLQVHINDDKEFKHRMDESMSITLDFTEKQCRNIIKNVFYKYRCAQRLPLYERKTLLDIEDLYINRLHKNHWGQVLVDEMKKWPVEYSGEDIDTLDNN